MAADPTAAQQNLVSTFRADLRSVLNTLSALEGDRLRAASLGGIDTFGAGAFAGANADVTAADLDAAMTALTGMRALLFDGTGNPTAALLTLAKVAS